MMNGQKRELVPAGVYRAHALPVQSEDGETLYAMPKVTDKGQDFIEVVMEIVEGEHTGRRFWWKGFLSTEAAPYTLKALRDLGWTDGDMFAACYQVLDRVVPITVSINEYNGNTNNRIRIGIAPPVKGKGNVDKMRLKKLSAELASIAPAATPSETEELPF